MFGKSSDIKYNKNPPSGSGVIPCRRTDITKLTVPFRNFANAAKKHAHQTSSQKMCVHYVCRYVSRQWYLQWFASLPLQPRPNPTVTHLKQLRDVLDNDQLDTHLLYFTIRLL